MQNTGCDNLIKSPFKSIAQKNAATIRKMVLP